MQQKQNLLTPSFLSKYASKKFFKWVIMCLVPLFSILVVLIVIQFILGGNPFAAPEPDTTSQPGVSDPLQPSDQTGPPMVYVPEQPERKATNEAFPIYKIMMLAPEGVTIVSIDSFETTNGGAADNTLLYETNIQDATMTVSGFAPDMALVSTFIQTLEGFNEYGTFTVRDDGRNPIGETPYSMFKLSITWRAPT